MIETIGHQLVTDALLIVVMMAVLGWVECRRGMPRPARTDAASQPRVADHGEPRARRLTSRATGVQVAGASTGRKTETRRGARIQA